MVMIKTTLRYSFYSQYTIKEIMRDGMLSVLACKQDGVLFEAMHTPFWTFSSVSDSCIPSTVLFEVGEVRRAVTATQKLHDNTAFEI